MDTISCPEPIRSTGPGWATLSEVPVAAGTTGVWRSLVARFVRDEEVAGSNPVTPTSNARDVHVPCVAGLDHRRLMLCAHPICDVLGDHDAGQVDLRARNGRHDR